MKKLFSIIVSLAFLTIANAQTKPVELYDVLKSIAIDSAAPTATNVSWQKGIAMNPIIKWDNKTIKYNAVLKEYSKFGAVVMKANNTKASKADISLTGKSKDAYSSVEISFANAPDDYTLEKLLGKKIYKATLVKTGELNDYYYKLKLAGKKELYLSIWYDAGGSMNPESSLYINCFYDYNDLKKKME